MSDKPIYKLVKCSHPGWTKSFDTLKELTDEVYENTCSLCKDSYGTDLLSMLASDCGCEFEAEGIMLDHPLSSYEDLQNQYDELK